MKTAPPLGITRVVQQVFAASGTYTPTPGMISCEVECQGSGGGGGGSAASTAGNSTGAGGGGAGEYSRIILTAAQIGASQTVTVGAAGAGGTAGNNAGTNGAASSVGTLCTANGGAGGGGSTGTTVGQGGAAGSGGTGSQKVGRAGDTGVVYASVLFDPPTARGGDSMWGQGGRPRTMAAGAAGLDATGFGGGGAGAGSYNASVQQAGGAGTIGYVRITEYVR